MTSSVTDDAGRVFTHSESIAVTNAAPNAPTASATVTRTVKDHKFLVNFTVSASDPDGDAVTYEYTGQSADGYYAAGSHTVKVRAKDAYGAYSDWTDINFTVANSAPSTPIITRTPNGNSVPPNTPVNITASSTDPDGDAITYVGGQTAQTSTYPLGKKYCPCESGGRRGAESPGRPSYSLWPIPNGGGMTLTVPNPLFWKMALKEQPSLSTPSRFLRQRPQRKRLWRVRGYTTCYRRVGSAGLSDHNQRHHLQQKAGPGIYSKLEFYYTPITTACTTSQISLIR